VRPWRHESAGEILGTLPDPIEDLVRSGYAAFNAGQRRATLEFWHADGVYVNDARDPDPAIHRGIEAVSAQNARWVEAYPDLRVEPLEIRTNGERAFVWVRFSGQGARSGVPIDMELAHVVTYEAGKIRRIEEYSDRTEGLAAAGLAE
jgi:ketosteroid isomerase-like protein